MESGVYTFKYSFSDKEKQIVPKRTKDIGSIKDYVLRLNTKSTVLVYPNEADRTLLSAYKKATSLDYEELQKLGPHVNELHRILLLDSTSMRGFDSRTKEDKDSIVLVITD